MELITSTSNPKIKMIRSLRMKKFRDEHDLFLTEGIHHVGSAFEAGWKISAVFYDPDHLTSSYGADLIDKMVEHQIECHPVSREVFENIAEKENTLGIIASVRKQSTFLNQLKDSDLLAAMVTPQDPGNVGSMLRTLDSIGGGGLVLLDGGVDPYHPTLIRASMGSFFWNSTVSTRFTDLAEWGKKHGFHLIGTSAKGSAMRDFPVPMGKKILLFGSEQKGLDSYQVNECDALISLPMNGHISSLNISVAAGIILYKLAGLT